MSAIITKEQINNMLEFLEKQNLGKSLGRVFCEDFGLMDHEIFHQADNVKAADLIFKRYGSWGK